MTDTDLTALRTVVTITPTDPTQPGNYRVIVNDGAGNLTPYIGPEMRSLNLGANGRLQVESLTGAYEVTLTKTYQGTNFTDTANIRSSSLTGVYGSTLAVAPTPGATQPSDPRYTVTYITPTGTTEMITGSGTQQVTTRTPALLAGDDGAAITNLNGTYDFTTTITGNFGPQNRFPLVPEDKPDNFNGGGGSGFGSVWMFIIVALIVVGLIWLLMRSATQAYRPSPHTTPRIVVPTATVPSRVPVVLVG